MQYLDDELENCVDASDLFRSISSLEGEVYRNVGSRKTFRFEWQENGYFAKTHSGVGWLEILKNLVQFRLPVIDASNEWYALRKLKDLGVETMEPVAYVNQGWNPASRRSCIVTRELKNTISLEDFCAGGMPVSLKRKLIKKLAGVSKLLHNNGINHRDYYICHFLMDVESIQGEVPMVYLIDLHRAQIRRNTPVRWKVKDVGGLFFSTFDLDLTKRDLFRFMKFYSGRPLRECLQRDGSFWQAVLRRAISLYLQDKTELPGWILRLPQGVFRGR